MPEMAGHLSDYMERAFGPAFCMSVCERRRPCTLIFYDTAERILRKRRIRCSRRIEPHDIKKSGERPGPSPHDIAYGNTAQILSQTALPISVVETGVTPGSAMSPVRMPASSTAVTALSMAAASCSRPKL